LRENQISTGIDNLVVDGLPAHKTSVVKDYVQSTERRLTLHFLPRYAPELNSHELVWSHMTPTGVGRTPLRKDERSRDKIEPQLARFKAAPRAQPVIFQSPSVAYIID
jgi:transposase